MDRLEAMSVLLAAVESGSLSAASRKLGMPLATVSRKVSELEAHLRTRLVNRTSRRLELTDADRSYVAACKRIVEDVEEAELIASSESGAAKGNLTIAAPIVFGRLHVPPGANKEQIQVMTGGTLGSRSARVAGAVLRSNCVVPPAVHLRAARSAIIFHAELEERFYCFGTVGHHFLNVRTRCHKLHVRSNFW